MAKTPSSDEDRKKPKGAAAQAATWVIVAMLIAGLGGFGITSFQGSVTSVGSVGDVTVSTDDYARALRAQINDFSRQVGQPLGLAEAQAFGIDQAALQGLIARATLDHAADRAGLSVGDDRVAQEILAQPAFIGANNAFDRAVYADQLQNAGFTETEYERQMRADIARSILTGAVNGGFTAPAPLADRVFAWLGERRGVSVLRLTEADLTTPLAAPTEAELQAHYDANIAEFTRGEAKRLSYAALLPETLAATLPADPAEVRALYDSRASEYLVPERRLVERLIFPDQAAADAALARAAAGAPFETLVIERGLTLADVDLGDVAAEDLGPAGAAVFAAAEGETVAAPTDLGPALFRVTGILDAQTTAFEDVQADLAAELATDDARRQIGDRVEQIDDLLAGGASLADLAREIGMETGTLDFIPTQPGTAKLEGYPAFRAAAEAIAAGDFPEAIILDDGGVVALEFVETVPAAPIPLAEALPDVETSWRKAALARALADQATAWKAAIEAGAAPATLGIVARTPDLARSGSLPDAPASLVATVFAMAKGDIRVIEEGDFVAVVQLDAITPAETAGDEATALRRTLDTSLAASFGADAAELFANAVAAEAGISIDQAAINAVNASLQ